MDDLKINIDEAVAKDLLTPRLKDLDVWSDLMDCFDEVCKANIERPIEQLELIRDMSKVGDRNIMEQTCRLLGFDLSQDVLSISVDSVVSLVTQLGIYRSYSGTKKFINFFSLMLNALSDCEYLYTDDYMDFYTKPKGKLITEGGSWYATTHVELSVALASLAGIVLKPGQSLYDRVKELFYDAAPAHLVIDRLYFTVTVNAEFGVAAALYTPSLTRVVGIDNKKPLQQVISYGIMLSGYEKSIQLN